MLVSTENLYDVLEDIKNSKYLAIDTETLGLSSFKGDSLFSIIISTDNNDYYFNFKDYPEESISPLPRSVIENLREIFLDDTLVFFMQNAKFDMHMLAREGLLIAGKVYDLMFLDRIYFNQHMSYNLTNITKRWGDEKLDIVWEYITKNKLITKTELPEFGKTIEQPHFDRVPFSIMQPYGEQDGRGTLNVGLKILESLKLEDSQLAANVAPQMQIVENEARLVHTLFRMEQRGVQLDVDYCRKALAHYFGIIKDVEEKFKLQTGLDFVKGTTVFEEVFASEKEKWEKTEKGNWKWDADVLETFKNPVAGLAISWSEAKKASEYFANFLFYCDASGVLHPDFQQSGTVTGRMSSRSPNMQNLSSPDKYEENTEAALYPVRKALVPRPGYFFAMIDYAQSEYRLFLEYAKANDVIREVLNGKDVHQANADIAGVTRKQAKTVGFGLLYGQGVGKLAYSLFDTMGSSLQVSAMHKKSINFGVTKEDEEIYKTCTPEMLAHDLPLIKKASEIKNLILKTNPAYGDLMKAITNTAKSRKYLRNFYGRRLQFTDSRYCYKAVNHLIQSSCADMIKFAMNEIDAYLKDKKSKMLLQIHDELVVETHESEEYILPEIKRIMESAYPYKLLPQIAEISWSKESMAQKLKWDK
jgi:DNA polymerase-1